MKASEVLTCVSARRVWYGEYWCAGLNKAGYHHGADRQPGSAHHAEPVHGRL